MGYFDSFDPDYLASMDNAIRSAEVKSRFTQLPDGKYQMYVQAVEVKESRYADSYPCFYMQLTVTDGEFTGRSVYKRYPLEPIKERLDILKTDLAMMGVDLRRMADLADEEKMSALLDQVLEVTIKSKPSNNGKIYPNYYLNRVVGSISEGHEVDPAETPWGK